MQRFRRGSVVAAILALTVVMAIPVAAFGALEDSATVASSTNPGIGENATWRWGWGNSLHPDIIVTSVPSDAGAEGRDQTLGLLYDVRQLNEFGAGAVTPTWDSSSLSPSPKGSWISGALDIARVNDVYGWTPDPLRATKRGEGLYGFTFLFYNQFRSENSTGTERVTLGLDFTDPLAVNNLAASNAGLTMAPGGWTESRRRNLMWDRFAYDALSGVGGYQVSVNASDTVFAHNTAPNPAYEHYASLLNPGGSQLPPINHVTVEDLPAGRSTVSVTVVDRATNKSPSRSVLASVDYDSPTLAVVAPVSGARIGLTPTFTVKAADAAGISRVSYYVDDVPVGVALSEPYSLKANLSAFAGGAHTLKVVAEDQIGTAPGVWNVAHAVTNTVAFTLDKKPVKLSAFSRTPALFYPIRRDKYFDNSTIKYTLNKPAIVTLTVRSSSGSVVRTLTSNRTKAGKYSFVWNGKWKSDGKAHTGKYSYQITAVDSAGYKASTSKITTTIRNYQLIKTGRDSVKVIAR